MRESGGDGGEGTRKPQRNEEWMFGLEWNTGCGYKGMTYMH